MARSIWKKTLVASLAWASFGWAQEPAPSSRAMPDAVPASVERVITVQETGMPSHKCKITKTWQTPEGATAYQVQALDTGEFMTIVENGPITSVAGTRPGTRVHAVSTRIFHSSKSSATPADAPRVPDEIVKPVSATAAEQGPVQTDMTPVQIDEKPVQSYVAPAQTQVAPAQTYVAPAQTYVAPAQATEERPSLLSRLTGKSRSREVTTSPYACNDCQTCETQPAHRATVSSPYAPVTACNPCDETAARPAMSEQKTFILPALTLSKETQVTEAAPLMAQTDRSKEWRTSWGKSDTAQAPVTVEMPQADSTKPDPLQAPESLFTRLKEKRSLFKIGAAKKPETTPEIVEGSGDQDKGEQLQDKGAKLPPGSQSVVGAGAALGGQVQFVPMPIITMPDMNHPPMPPLHAPQPVMQPNGTMGNYAAVNKAPGPNMTTTDEGMVNAFTSMPSREAVAMGSNAFTDGETAAAQAMMPQGAQAMYPRSPYGAMAQGAPMRTAMPAAQAIMPASYQAYTPTAPMAAAGPAEQQMLSALRDSLYPSQREWAAEGLATLDWRMHPEIVQALVKAAREDPAATVRAAGVHHLARMNVNTLPVLEAVQKCKADSDPRVRQEAEQALLVLYPGHQGDSRSMVQPVGSWRPN